MYEIFDMPNKPLASITCHQFIRLVLATKEILGTLIKSINMEKYMKSNCSTKKELNWEFENVILRYYVCARHGNVWYWSQNKLKSDKL